MMIEPDVTHYLEGHQYLVDVWRHKRNHNARYSIKAWSLKMGFSHPSSLEYLLNGKRKIRPNHVRYIVKGIQLNQNERNYFEELIQFENCENAQEKAYYKERLRKIADYQKIDEIEPASMFQIYQWHHFAVLAMTQLKGFRNDPKWIAKRLKNQVDETQIVAAIERLLKIGLLKQDEKNQIQVTSKRAFSFSKLWESIGIVKYQRQVMALAKKSIGVDPETIYFSSSMTIDTRKLGEARALTQTYVSQMAALMEKEAGDETYQLNVQFFGLTKGFDLPEAQP